MEQMRLGKGIRRAAIPLACAALFGACASYDYEGRSYTSVPAADTPMALFDRLDTNRDGFLSRAELEPLGIASASPRIESASAAFDRLDANRDGFLSPGEAGNHLAPVPGYSFAGFDTDRDGFLSRSEAMPHLQWLYNRQASPTLDAYDTNRDGFLSRAEAEPLMGITRYSDGRWVIVGPAAAGSFDRWDIDRDGFLSRREAASLAPGIFERYDTNRDGFLSRSEADPMFSSAVGATSVHPGGLVVGPRY
jgi:Ca2+-binding EF-hand superfamily protein